MVQFDLTESLREITDDSRVSELAEGVLFIDGDITVLLISGSPKHSNRNNLESEKVVQVVSEELDSADYVFASIEGAVLSIQGTTTDFQISYLPEYLGGIQQAELSTVVDELYQGKLYSEPLPTNYLSFQEQEDISTLLEGMFEANLTSYFTPSEVAYIAANWATSGDRASVIDVACGSGEFLTTAVNATEFPDQAWGIDRNGLACAIAESRAAALGIPSDHILGDNFFEVFSGFISKTGFQTTTREHQVAIPEGGFDCVFAHPPTGRVRGQNAENQLGSEISRIPRLEHQFVHGACKLLADSGRGCFILPSHGIRELREHGLPNGVVLKRLIKLPESAFPVIGVEPILACVERTSEEEELGIINIRSFDDLDRIAGAVHATKSANKLSHVDAVSVEPDLPSTTVRTLLSAPGAASLFSEQFPTLEDFTENIATGMVTGANSIFYFDETERATSGIDEKFFTPVIKSLPDSGNEITGKHIDMYLFDLRKFVRERDLDKHDFAEVSKGLSSVDTAAGKYVQETLAPTLENKSRSNGVLPRSIPLSNPDLVTGAITNSLDWYQVNVDAPEVLYNNSVVGISFGGHAGRETLQTLLNTPLYQRLIEKHLPNLDAEYVRVQIRPLQRLPMILQNLSNESLERLQSLRPYKSTESKRTARVVLLEGLPSPQRAIVSATYDAVSPLSTLEAYQDQIDWLESAIEHASEEKQLEPLEVDEQLLYQLEETYQSAELFDAREELISELLMVYSEDRYWSFMGGMASQFEGILQDYIENAGGKVEYRETEEGNNQLQYFYQNEWKKLRLKVLFDDFFSGELHQLMQKVRKRRNDIAHGRLLHEPEANADVILTSFFVFTYAVLHEYNEYLGAEKTHR